MNKDPASQSGLLNRRVLLALSLCSAGGLLAMLSFAAKPPAGISKPLTFEQRVADQHAIEEVRWRHREWPANNPLPKPPLSQVLPEAALREKVNDTLRMSNALESFWHEKVTGERLQAEINRMVGSTKQPQVLSELFAALGNDPHRIAESLARPLLTARLLHNARAGTTSQSFETQWRAIRETVPTQLLDEPVYNYETPAVTTSGCTDDSWRPTPAVPERGLHTAVWTGSEMLIWGGELEQPNPRVTNTGQRYDPATDTWRDMTTVGAPAGREAHSAVWTGTEMIIFGGSQCCGGPAVYYGDVRRYNPVTDTWTAGSSTGAPSIRQFHTAVWTGTEMIVWGGSELNCTVPVQCLALYVNTGARYNPATDHWTTMSSLLAPLPRGYQTAVWTGQKMVVWGGQDSKFYRGDGGLYDPATDSWKSMTMTNPPSARIYHTAVWTNRQMIIWGGYNGSELNAGGRYDPVSDTWTATSLSSAPEARDTHSAVWAGSRMIIWGGSSNGRPLNSGGLYDPAADSWQATADVGAPSPRYEHTAVWTGSEMIVWGGLQVPDLLASGGRYDPIQNRWLPTGTRGAPSPRRNHTGVWTGAEMIIWGGVGPETAGNDGARYEPATDSWSLVTLQNAPAGRSDHVAVWTGKEMIVWGGQGNGLLDTGGRYNPSVDTWTATRQLNAPTARSLFTAVWSGNEMIVWGGFICTDPPTCSNILYTNSGGRYNPSTDTWLPTDFSSAPAGRTTHVAVWAGNEMIVWGGFGCNAAGVCNPQNATQLNTGGRYRPTSDTWVPTPTGGAPIARDFFSAVWTGKEMIVWGGGNEAPPYFNTGGRYDPAADSWALTSTTGAPSGRNVPTAVWTGQEMIIWGGYDDSLLPINTGGRYDPRTNNWRPTTTVGAPPGRDLHTAIWTGNEMIVWGGEFLFPSLVGGRYCAAVSVPPVQLASIVSRKIHGSAGTFDINLPLIGPRGIECRSGGANGDYTMIFSFVNTIGNVSSAGVTAGTGSVESSAIGADAHQYVVNLKGVANAQYITVTLTNVNDSAGNYSSSVQGKMGVLIGDVNANGLVTNADVSLVKAQVAAGASVGPSNFRDDVNANGVFSNADVSLTKAQVAAGAQLPTPP